MICSSTWKGPKKILSYKGTNLIGADREIKKMMPRIASYERIHAKVDEMIV